MSRSNDDNTKAETSTKDETAVNEGCAPSSYSRRSHQQENVYNQGGVITSLSTSSSTSISALQSSLPQSSTPSSRRPAAPFSSPRTLDNIHFDSSEFMQSIHLGDVVPPPPPAQHHPPPLTSSPYQEAGGDGQGELVSPGDTLSDIELDEGEYLAATAADDDDDDFVRIEPEMHQGHVEVQVIKEGWLQKQCFRVVDGRPSIWRHFALWKKVSQSVSAVPPRPISSLCYNH